MTNRTLILNDGTEYELDWANADKGILNINLVTDAGFIELAGKFSDKNNTYIMADTFDGKKQKEYAGYTDLRIISKNFWREGTTLITLAFLQQGQTNNTNETEEVE